MTTQNYRDERRWANTDPSRHFNQPEPRKPDWREEYLELIKRGDEVGAHELRLRNDERYRERCEQEAATVFPVTSAPLQSLSEGASELEREEMEAA